MEEKTAKIPSLKEFKESRMERDAQSQRSSSMQTKKQLQKNISKSSQKNGGKKKASSAQKRSAEKSQSGANSSRASSQGARNSQSSAKAGQRANRRSSASEYSSRQRSTEQAPRIYARDRIREEKATAEERNVSRARSSSEPLRQYRSQNGTRRGASEQKGRRADSSQQVKVKKPTKHISPKARKFRSFVIYLAIVFVVILVGAVLSLTVLFKTESINVSGNELYSAEEIIKASGLYLGENIFTAPKGRASDKIEKAYPYIEEADVYFVIPDAINIDIKMAKPAYMVEALGGFYIVSDTGKVLEVSSTDDEVGIPVIEGVSVESVTPGEYMEYGSDIVTTSLQEIFSAFKTYGAEKITAVNVEDDDDGTVKFRYVYDNRIVVYLGMPDNLTYKIQTAETILKEKIDVNNAAVAGELDVSTCHEGKKQAYFNEYSLLPDNVAPTQASTEASESSEGGSY